MAEAARRGVVVPEGLIAQGRGEAFDYFLGERTTPSARRAEHAAADWLRTARHPVLSVNGNVAALASAEVAALVGAVPHLAVEVNLFHRTPARAEAIARRLRNAGVPEVLGVRPNAKIPGLPSDRARVDARGIARADVCLIPLEDGDRAEALRRLGKTVIAIDLNPMSRTALAADLPIIDDVVRALGEIARAARRRRRRSPAAPRAGDLLAAAREEMARGLARGIARPSRRRAR